MPTATVTAQVTEAAALGTLEQGAPLHIPQPQGGNIPAEMVSLCVNIGNAHWVYCCQVEDALRDPCLPVLPSALICAMFIWAQSCCVPSVPLLFLTPMPSNSMPSGHITLGLCIQLKECYTHIHKKELLLKPICIKRNPVVNHF